MYHYLPQTVGFNSDPKQGFFRLLLIFNSFFFRLGDGVPPRLLSADQTNYATSTPPFGELGADGRMLGVVESQAGSSSVFYTPDKPQRSNWRCSAAPALCGHRRELQLAAVEAPFLFSRSPSTLPKRSGSLPAGLIWYAGSPFR